MRAQPVHRLNRTSLTEIKLMERSGVEIVS
jgi:hypothetical protein